MFHTLFRVPYAVPYSISYFQYHIVLYTNHLHILFHMFHTIIINKYIYDKYSNIRI